MQKIKGIFRKNFNRMCSNTVGNKNSLSGRYARGRGRHFDEKTMMKHDHVAEIPRLADWQIVEHFFR